MSGYRPGHEQGHNPYVDYPSQAENSGEERVYVSQTSNTRHDSAQTINAIDEPHLGAPQNQNQSQTPQNQSQNVYSEHEMAHASPHYSGGPGLVFGSRQISSGGSGTKRARPEEMELEIESMPSQSIHQRGLHGIQSQIGQQSILYGGQSVQAYHNHPLPNPSHRSKIQRLSDDDSMNVPSAPSVVGMEGMPPPAPRPRGPKLKFTPEDDALLVDLKENKSLTWKQIADFFPGRSSGTLQVRYCTKLKAKTTQWTEETEQKLRTALHDYEQEKWRIIAQKVGTGFTSTACMEKAAEL